MTLWPRTLAAVVRTVLLAILVALAFRAFVAQPYSIPTDSMLPALRPGEHVLALRAGHVGGEARLPARGDVIVFDDPAGGDGTFVKRVIGLAGETVALKAGVVTIDGATAERTRIADFHHEISENFPCLSGRQADGLCVYPRYRETIGGVETETLDATGRARDFGPVTVPAGHLFVLGDNRGGSLDSRFGAEAGGFGMVPVSAIVGTAGPVFLSSEIGRIGSRP